MNTNDGENLKILLGKNIKYYRINSGYSIEEMAEKAGISIPFLGAIERGEKWPSPATLSGIAHGLDLNPCDLLIPEGTVSGDIQKITAKLAKDLFTLVNQSIKTMNNIVREDKTDNS